MGAAQCIWFSVAHDDGMVMMMFEAFDETEFDDAARKCDNMIAAMQQRHSEHMDEPEARATHVSHLTAAEITRLIDQRVGQKLHQFAAEVGEKINGINQNMIDLAEALDSKIVGVNGRVTDVLIGFKAASNEHLERVRADVAEIKRTLERHHHSSGSTVIDGDNVVSMPVKCVN